MFYTKYNRPRNPSIKFDPMNSRTIGSEKDSCDINLILETYKSTGKLPNTVANRSFMARNPMYGDFSNATDYTTVRYALDEANRMFMELPAKVRKRFDNDPQKLVAFLSDEANRDEAEELGLIEKTIKQIVPAVKPTEPARTEKSEGGESGTGAQSATE